MAISRFVPFRLPPSTLRASLPHNVCCAIISLTLSLLCIATAAPAAETARVRVIDNSSATSHSAPKAGPDTRVITLKGKEAPAAGAAGDICPETGSRFYCAHLGKTAVEKSTGAALGEITGVAWKNRDDAITRYLPEGWHALAPDSEVFSLNAPASEEGFFYIIKGEGKLSFMVECARVEPQAQ